MADEKELELDNGGGNKKKLIIIIAVVVLLLAGGGGYFFFMSGSDEPSAADIDAALDSGEASTADVAAEPTGASAGNALYVPMPRPFRFNVPGTARDRFVEIRVQLLVRGSDNEEESKKHVPLIENTLLSVFSQANADDLATSAGKTSLKQKALAAVQKEMTEINGKKTVEQVLFTGFVMQ
ncbi:flagellar basal body-associated protein FliL [Thalassotalea atypica]|uniref:flagellar basal body-associated protein FliL n=1 Tax=Thalassotalea atypica TaxID=2054316 RepID=UPI002572EB7B|nr:flagellar basal body-associated protein FliL [Thalassotalea atypica]